MNNGYVTTPFGRRPMSLGMLANQHRAETVEPETTRNKWKLFRAICEARPSLGVTDRALTVLDALLTFYPTDELTEERGLVVFPSNAQLSIRARGMTPATLRRHLAALVDAGLILRKDSPNGKRYARRDRAGDVNEAFGFSLAPLLARATELEGLAAQVVANREFLRASKERLTLCRRDIAKLIETAIGEGLPGDWDGTFAIFRAMVDGIPRTTTIETLSPLLEKMLLLRELVVNQLKMNIKADIMSAKESQNERHIQDSHPESFYESEPSLEPKREEIDTQSDEQPSREARSQPISHATDGDGRKTHSKHFPPLGLVLQACPEISAYGPGGTINNWRDLMTAAVLVRSMLAVSPSAYMEACAVMGPENAATVIACIFERGGHINSAGGYLRDLTRRSQCGEFTIGPMLVALARANGPSARAG